MSKKNDGVFTLQTIFGDVLQEIRGIYSLFPKAVHT